MKKILLCFLCLCLLNTGCTISVPDGQLLAVLAGSVSKQDYAAVTEISCDLAGEDVALYADGTISDLKIHHGIQDPESGEFTASELLYEAQTMDDQTLLLMRVEFTDASTTVRISYTGASGQVVRYLVQSDKDSSIVLTEK